MERKTVSINAQLFRKWSRTYDFALFQFWMRRFQRAALTQIRFSPKTKLLDVSCGTGELLKTLAKRTGKWYGVDLSPEMLAIARTKLPASVILKKAQVHRLPFSDNYFEYVVSTEAFHHYDHQQKALKEMMRVAKKGGKVIVVDINFFLPYLHFLFQKIEPGCVKINSRKEMQRLFEQAELKNVQQQRSFLFAVMTVGKKEV